MRTRTDLAVSKILPLMVLTGVLGLISCDSQQNANSDNAVSATPAVADHPYANTFQSQCSSCHGTNGEGNGALKAPGLTSQQTWYLERQLRHFRDGVRGTHPQDEEGRTMASASAGLNEETLLGLVDYLQVLSQELPPLSVSSDARGNLKRGEDYHNNLCAACHRSDAQGNEALQAPALTGLDPEYISRQYEKFRAGIRGAHRNDPYGAQMVRLAPAVEDPDIVRDIAAFLATLPVTES